MSAIGSGTMASEKMAAMCEDESETAMIADQ